jgi:hypothetical protein
VVLVLFSRKVLNRILKGETITKIAEQYHVSKAFNAIPTAKKGIKYKSVLLIQFPIQSAKPQSDISGSFKNTHSPR